MIIEEAAGVLKYRRRKEKAERRLESTEGNLLRLQDLLREVKRQLRPLERQADAARRHGDLVAELASLRLHLAGREIASLRARADHGAQARTSLAAQEADLKATLAHLDTLVMTAESSLSATDAAGLTDAVGRLEALRERARGLAALLAERGRSVERDRSVTVDRNLIAALEAESSALTNELREIEVARGARTADRRARRGRAGVAGGARRGRGPLGRRRRHGCQRRRGGAGRALGDAHLRRSRPHRVGPAREPPRLAARARRAPRRRCRAPARRARGCGARRAAVRHRGRRGRAPSSHHRGRGGEDRERSGGGPRRTARRGPHAPRRWPSRSTRRGHAPGPSDWPTSTASWARCSSWSRSSPVGSRPSGPPRATRSRRSWWPMPTPPAARWRG